jgi:hypothetical protein
MKKLVWAMKRHHAQGGGKVGTLPSKSAPYTTSAPAATSAMDRGDSYETNAILREIRDELRQMNSNLQSKG